MAAFRRLIHSVPGLAFLLLLTFAASQAAHAQTTGVISGVVTDKSGGRIANVKVTARDTSSGEVRIDSTNTAGEYSFPSLKPGDYTITFQLQGFATMVEVATLN